MLLLLYASPLKRIHGLACSYIPVCVAKYLKGYMLYLIRVVCLYYIYAADEMWTAAMDKENEEFTREMWDMCKKRVLDSRVITKN
jgi:hypothetical protein